MLKLPMRGRAVPENPPNRFERVHCEMDPAESGGPGPKTEFIPDRTVQVLAENNSPDVPFDVSLNAYRGCSHGCVYCYARPTHEYLGYSSGLDFEQKILVKHRAPELLRKALSKRGWRPRVLGMSGVTDPYQPAERRFRLTRGCLEVLRDFRNPVSLITKNHLVTRDVDLLAELADFNGVHVTLSITSLDRTLQRVMEPRTSVPGRRLRAIETLAKAGVPVGVNLAPIIPGLTDEEVPRILAASRDAGATYAAFILLRLPLGVADHFDTWLSRHFPDRKDRILGRIRAMRGGSLND
ncbi:MAG: PA0069 family radical SAM protein, partial [Longimicrobiales bacterium]